jgi:RimJ/RimL family protein N-acetyltransferase
MKSKEGAIKLRYLTEMMRLASSRCFNDSALFTVLVDPLSGNMRAHRFYERLDGLGVRDDGEVAFSEPIPDIPEEAGG